MSQVQILPTRPEAVMALALKELYAHFAKIEEILATLEEQSDKQGLERTEKSLEEYREKEVFRCQ